MKKKTGSKAKAAGPKRAKRKNPPEKKPATKKPAKKKPARLADPMSSLLREFLAAGADAEALSKILRVIGVDRYEGAIEKPRPASSRKRRPKPRK